MTKDIQKYFKGLVSSVKATEHHKSRGEAEIFYVSQFFKSSSKISFEEACIDSGVQSSFIGQKPASIYSAASLIQFVPSKVPQKYKFGNKTCPGIRNIHTGIPVTDDFYINITPNIVHINVSFLLELDVLIHLKALLDFDENWISSRHGNCSIPLTWNLGYLYIIWPINVYYMEQELRKIHWPLHNPQTERMVFIIKRAAPEVFSPKTYSDL